MGYTIPQWTRIIAAGLSLSGVPPLPTHRFPNAFVYKKFRTSAGSAALNIDGSTPVTFFVEAPAAMFAVRVNFSMADNAMEPGKFGGLTALSNGMRLILTDKNGVELFDFLDGDTAVANQDFALLAGVDNVITPAAGDSWLPIRWTLERAGAKMRMNTGDELRLVVQDNLTGLSYFQAMLQGILIEG